MVSFGLVCSNLRVVSTLIDIQLLLHVTLTLL